jgi:translation initiation factor 1
MSKKGKMKKIDLESFFIGSDENREEFNSSDQPESIPNAAQNLFVRKERKRRAGKVVSIIEGFQGPPSELDHLAREIKQLCGTGGAVKEGEIIIQGDKSDSIVEFLRNRGFNAKKTTM